MLNAWETRSPYAREAEGCAPQRHARVRSKIQDGVDSSRKNLESWETNGAGGRDPPIIE